MRRPTSSSSNSRSHHRSLPRRRSSAAALLLLWCGCTTQKPPTFADHAELYQRVEYSHGAGARGYEGRLGRSDAVAEFLREVDDYLVLYRRLLDARSRTLAAEAALDPRTPASHRDLYRDEVRRLDDAALDLGRLLMQLLGVASGERVIEIIPELNEGLRLCAMGHAPGLNADDLREAQRRLGTGSAACGAETPDFLQKGQGGHPPQAWIDAKRALESTASGIVLEPRHQQRLELILRASAAQRQALAHYGMPRGIVVTEGGGKIWRFQFGGLLSERRPGSVPVDARPRVLRVECEFDPAGLLVGVREWVLTALGEQVDLSKDSF